MNRTIRGLAAVGAAVAALGGASAAAAGPAAAAGHRVQRCGTLQLRITTAGWNGGAGHVDGNLVFTNTGRYTCHLVGYPGVSAVDGQGRQLGPDAARTPSSYGYVDIRPGYAAYAPIEVTQAGNYDPPACEPAKAKSLRVYPPNDRYPELVPFGAEVCTTSIAVLHVRPVQPGPL